MGDFETTLEVLDYRNDPDAKDLAGVDAAHQVLLEITVTNHQNEQKMTGLLWLGELATILQKHGFCIKEL